MRTDDMIKLRYKNMLAAYKKFKSEASKTGGGAPPQEQPFFKHFDEAKADDCRVHGVEGSSEIGKQFCRIPF